MTRLQFVGDLPLVAAVVIAIVGTIAAWRFYRRETRGDIASPLSWLLPMLRCLALLLVLFILSGPILRHRHTIGQLGRILVFVDNSRSMALADDQMPVAQKLLIAQQHGWLPADTVDASLWRAADDLATLRQKLAGVLAEIDLGESEELARTDALRAFQREVASLKDQLNGYDASLLNDTDLVEDRSWDQFLEDFNRSLVVGSDVPADSPDGALISREIVTAASIAEHQIREWFDVACRHLAESGDAAITTALASFDGHSRWSRVETSLLDPDVGLFAELSSQHHLELFALSGEEAVRLWDSYGTDPLPTSLDAVPSGARTNLAAAIRRELAEKVRGGSGQAREGKTAVLIVSDGQHNRGAGPIELAEQLGEQGVPVFTLGMGGSREPTDLAVLRIEHPKAAHRSDTVRGVVTIKDRFRAGTPFVMQITDQQHVVWEKELRSNDVDERRVAFEFPLDDVVTRAMEAIRSGDDVSSLAVALEASIVPLSGESEVENNRAPLRIKTTVRDRKVLMIGGRARWEFRYLRNLFERDERWEANTVIAGPGTDSPTMRRGDEPGMFPVGDNALQAYDLIVLGEVAPDVLQGPDQWAIRRFVENHAGGLIFVDGSRGHLRQLDDAALLPLLPVEWIGDAPQRAPKSIALTAVGREDASLMLASSQEENAQLWEYLPPPHAPVLVKAVPGAETLAEVVFTEGDGSREVSPLFVKRPFGAGRIMYCAGDETWRWRFKNADAYHQRFWNQVANSLIEEPFAIHGDYLSLDTDSVTYQPNEQARLRVRLRDTEGAAVLEASADALLWNHGKLIATIQLVADENESGVFRGQTPPLPAGDYEVSVQAAGFSSEALAARVPIAVYLPAEDELKLLRRNDELLNAVALVSDGAYVREEQYQKLAEQLRPLSTGRVIETETVLWQSYWWFCAVLSVLGIEWLLRKRAGLL
jgi:hypothetical protein